MLMIRLQRVGRKHEPVFRLVLTDSQNGPKSGKFLEILGSYDMRVGDSSNFKSDRIKELMSKGAQVSDTVHNLLVDKKIVEGKKINKLPKKTVLKKEGEEAPAEVAPEPNKAEESTPSTESEAAALPTSDSSESESRPESVGTEATEETKAEVASEPTS